MAAFTADEGAEDDEKVQGQALALKVDEIQPCLTGNADAAVEGIGLGGRGARLRHLFLRICLRLRLRCLQRSGRVEQLLACHQITGERTNP